MGFNQTSFLKNNRIRYSKLTGKIYKFNSLCIMLAGILIHFLAKDYHLCIMVQHIEKLPEKAHLKMFISGEKKDITICVQIIQHLQKITDFFLKFRTYQLVDSEPQLCHLHILVD